MILRTIALAIVYCLQTENTPLYLKQRNGVTSVLLQQTEHFLCDWYLGLSTYIVHADKIYTLNYNLQ